MAFHSFRRQALSYLIAGLRCPSKGHSGPSWTVLGNPTIAQSVQSLHAHIYTSTTRTLRFCNTAFAFFSFWDTQRWWPTRITGAKPIQKTLHSCFTTVSIFLPRSLSASKRFLTPSLGRMRLGECIFWPLCKVSSDAFWFWKFIAGIELLRLRRSMPN